MCSLLDFQKTTHWERSRSQACSMQGLVESLNMLGKDPCLCPLTHRSMTWWIAQIWTRSDGLRSIYHGVNTFFPLSKALEPLTGMGQPMWKHRHLSTRRMYPTDARGQHLALAGTPGSRASQRGRKANHLVCRRPTTLLSLRRTQEHQLPGRRKQGLYARGQPCFLAFARATRIHVARFIWKIKNENKTKNLESAPQQHDESARDLSGLWVMERISDKSCAEWLLWGPAKVLVCSTRVARFLPRHDSISWTQSHVLLWRAHSGAYRLAIDSLYQFAANVKGATLGYHFSQENRLYDLVMGPPLAVGAYIDDGRIHIPINPKSLPEELPSQRKFRNLTSDYTESCCWRSVNQQMWLRRCDIAEMWDMRIWRVGSARNAVFYHTFVTSPGPKVRS